MLDIYFSINNNKEIIKIPYIYPEMDIHRPSNNSTFENTFGEVFTLIGAEGLKSFNLDSFFPSKKYSWMPLDATLAEEALEFFQKNLLKIMKVVVISSTGRTMLNMLCTISDYKDSERQNGDYKYSMKVTEYIDPGRVR